jgi:GNAT superfamily N-acetyltransferase/quercetin dioxygenase-like cupin family protein
MTNFNRLLTDLDVGPLLNAIESRPQLWDEITVRQEAPGSPHHDTQCIWLRGPSVIDLHTVFNDTEAHDYPAMDALATEVTALVSPILQAWGVKTLGRVMIVSLAPGGAIDAHEDQGRYAKSFSRFHLVLASKPGNTFTCDGETVHMATGELWWFNHRGEHSVVNDSDEPRIHLIFDAQVEGFVVPPLTSVAKDPSAGVRIVETPMTGRIDEMWNLLHAHWDEVAKNKAVMVLKPDRARYEQLDEAGALLCIAAIDPDGEIVGYSVSFIGPHIHYADLITCNNDVLFLRADLRASRIGMRLLSETERVAKARGAKLMLWHAKEHTALATIMPRLGYGVQDIIFSKEI